MTYKTYEYHFDVSLLKWPNTVEPMWFRKVALKSMVEHAEEENYNYLYIGAGAFKALNDPQYTLLDAKHALEYYTESNTIQYVSVDMMVQLISMTPANQENTLKSIVALSLLAHRLQN